LAAFSYASGGCRRSTEYRIRIAKQTLSRQSGRWASASSWPTRHRAYNQHAGVSSTGSGSLRQFNGKTRIRLRNLLAVCMAAGSSEPRRDDSFFPFTRKSAGSSLHCLVRDVWKISFYAADEKPKGRSREEQHHLTMMTFPLDAPAVSQVTNRGDVVMQHRTVGVR
jgi:hypothetical protein